MLKRLFEAIKVVVGPETLETDPRPPSREKPSFFGWLAKSEKLPAPAVSVPPQSITFLRWLFGPEKLPPPEMKTAAGKSAFNILFSSESLPLDSVPEKKVRTRAGRRGSGKGPSSKVKK